MAAQPHPPPHERNEPTVTSPAPQTKRPNRGLRVLAVILAILLIYPHTRTAILHALAIGAAVALGALAMTLVLTSARR